LIGWSAFERRTDMRSESGGEIPVEIKRARLGFERWRKSRKKVTRIPDRLWDAAVNAARLHGVNPTAMALGLDYNHLKARTQSTSRSRRTRREKAKSPSFMELIVPSEARHFQECTVELENERGAKMKIHLQNVERDDLATWIQRFWSESR
jgi:hypothetical protein